VLAAGGLLLAGALSGLILSLLLPYRLFEVGVLPGSSIVFSPLITGFVMEAYGRRRVRRGLSRSYFSSFWGAAAFAFAMSVVRFAMVGRP